MLTVLTWFWRQPEARNQYEPHHVAIWADMVRRNLSTPHRIACVTAEDIDLPSHIEIIRPPREFENVRIPSWPAYRPQCLRRLTMFAPDAAATFGDRFVCMDLDCVIGAPLAPLFRTRDSFKICTGTMRGRPYNGSMMLLTAGARPQVYTEFSPAKAVAAGKKFVGSDQAWIADRLPGEATWGEADGVIYYGLPRLLDTVKRLMFFPGSTKPWGRFHDRWIADNYRRERQGRALVLGYQGAVWRDAAAALAAGPVAGVIASPEAAEHWPGVTAVARDDLEARQLARMHGFSDLAWCGTREAE